jgi:Ca2+-binding RTX toxin-like protein
MTRTTTAVLAVAATLMVAPLAVPAASATSAKTIEGTAGDDRLQGTALADVILGRAGDDVLRGGAGSDLLVGGAGADRLSDVVWIPGGDFNISKRRDVFRGGPGRDVIRAGPNDVVRAGNGNDHVWSYYTTSDTVLDCGPGSRDVLHLHNDIRGERIIGCEDIEIRYAS